MEQVVAIIGTAAVLALFLWGGGAGLLEGIAVYAVAGLAVWYWGRTTFWSETLEPEDLEENPKERRETGRDDHPHD